MTTTKNVARALTCGAIALSAVSTACTPEQQAAFVAYHGQRQAVLENSRSTSSLSDDQLHRLAKCESGNNPQAVSRSGSYHGLYQFNQRTWNGVAASVLPEYVGVKPSQTPAEVQDAMARELYSARGRSPWPHCGKRI